MDETAVRVGRALESQDQAVIDHLGFFDLKTAHLSAEVSLIVGRHMVNSQEVCHGGILYALADHALAYAAMSTNRIAPTLSAHIVFHRPAPLGEKLVARATVEAVEGRIVSGEAIITGENGQKIAAVQGVHYRTGRPVVELSEK